MNWKEKYADKIVSAEYAVSLVQDGDKISFGDWLGEPFGACGGFAVELEFYPDAPNHPDFPSALLRPGETFRRYALYRFSEAD